MFNCFLPYKFLPRTVSHSSEFHALTATIPSACLESGTTSSYWMSLQSCIERISPGCFLLTHGGAFMVVSTSVVFFHLFPFLTRESQTYRNCFYTFLRRKDRTSEFIWLWFSSFFPITPDVWFCTAIKEQATVFTELFQLWDLIPEQTQLTHGLSAGIYSLEFFSCTTLYIYLN